MLTSYKINDELNIIIILKFVLFLEILFSGARLKLKLENVLFPRISLNINSMHKTYRCIGLTLRILNDWK